MANIILLLSEHGAAKSVIAAAYFNKLASEKSINFHAIARGINLDAELSPKSEDYEKARDAIVKNLKRLVNSTQGRLDESPLPITKRSLS
jgi:hypothetical protein